MPCGSVFTATTTWARSSYTGNDFVIIDFEGEPQRPLSERRIKRLGLRDVAGMLRSYQYTSQMALREAMEGGVEEPDHAAHLKTGRTLWLDGWRRRSCVGTWGRSRGRRSSLTP